MATIRPFMVYENGESTGTELNLGPYAQDSKIGQRLILEFMGDDIVKIVEIGEKMFRCNDTGMFYVWVVAELTT